MLRKIAIACAVCVGLLINFNTADANTPHKKHPKKHLTQKKAGASKKSNGLAIPSTNSIPDGVNQILAAFPRINAGVSVQTLNGTILAQHNANNLFTPASTMKILTSTAALTYLGPNYVFKTQFLSNALPQNNGILAGNLYVKFSGDPTLTINDLSTLVAELKEEGIKTVQGNLMIDDTSEDHVNWADGLKNDEQMLCYAAPAGSIILNRNCFGFGLRPSGRLGQAPRVNNNGFGAISVINEVITRSSTASCPLELRSAAGSNAFLVSGCMRSKQAPVGLAVPLNDTRQAGTNILMNLLKNEGITLQAGVEYGETPPALHVLAENDSETLGVLINHMLKHSDNLYANTIFKTLGGVYFKTAGTWANGEMAVSDILTPKTGINFNTIVMKDGAGLSRQDLISPNQLVQVLRYAYTGLPAAQIFFQALPSSGIDGTLRFRLGGSTLGKIHAKTGTVDNISCLAGYVETINGKILVFAIMLNDKIGNIGTYHLLQDRICKFLSQKPIDPTA